MIPEAVPFELAEDDLLIVSYGIGVDSTSVLVEFEKRGIVPDLILFADPGGEYPETYEFAVEMNCWLMRVGFPLITTVRYEPVRATYRTLEEKCLANDGLPSLAYGAGKHSCALVFKRDVMNKFLKTYPPIVKAIAEGRRIVKVIGYDDSKADRRRSAKSDGIVAKNRAKIAARAEDGKAPLAETWEAAYCELWHPLQDWGLAREALPAIIEEGGLSVPHKSCCFFCPAHKPSEVVQLRLDHPELFERAVAMERNAREGRHGLGSGEGSVKGLGLGGWAWEWLADVDDPALAAAVLLERGVKVKDVLRP
jgi:hypothetical protein